MNLKTLLLTWLTALALNAVKSQTVQDSVAQDTVNILQQKSDLQLTHLYAWAYAIGTADEQSVQTGNMHIWWNIRAWGRAVWNISNTLSANWLLAYDYSTDGNMLHLAAMDWQPVTWTKVTAWRTWSAATQMTDLPVSPWGDFLFSAESDAVAPGLWVKVNQQIGNLTVAGSGMIREGGIEPSIWFNKGLLSWALVLDPATQKVNGWVSYTGDLTNGSSIFSMARIKPETISLSAMYTMPNKVGFFVDGKYDRDEQRMQHLLLGVLKGMKKDEIWVKIWASADLINHNVNTILFITLGGQR